MYYTICLIYIIINTVDALIRLILGPAQSEFYNQSNLIGEVGKKNKNFNYIFMNFI